MLHQLFTVLITLLPASLVKSSLWFFYITFQGLIAHPRVYFFSPFLPVCEKQCRETKWTCSVNFPALARLHAWRHMLIRHMQTDHIWCLMLSSSADCLLPAPSVILSSLSFSGLRVAVTSQRTILIRTIWRQMGWKVIWKSRKPNAERTAEIMTSDSQIWEFPWLRVSDTRYHEYKKTL